jgi:hypothetical protein
LTVLGLNGNNLGALPDISQLTELKSLYVDANGLQTIDVTMFPKLKNLSVNGNNLTSIDVSQNPALEWFGVNDNPVTSLDVANNGALKYLNAVNNTGLTSLDLSGNPALLMLSAENSGLTSLDLSNNPDMTHLFIVGNPGNDDGEFVITLPESFTLPAGFPADGADIDPEEGVVTVVYGAFDVLNMITDANFKTYALSMMDSWDENDDGHLSQAEAAAIEILDLPGDWTDPVSESEQVKSLDGLEYFKNLSWLEADYHGIEGVVNVSKNPKLTHLQLDENQLTGIIGLENLEDLEEFRIYNNKLTSIDVSHNINLNLIDCGHNLLKSLDFSALSHSTMTNAPLFDGNPGENGIFVVEVWTDFEPQIYRDANPDEYKEEWILNEGTTDEETITVEYLYPTNPEP